MPPAAIAPARRPELPNEPIPDGGRSAGAGAAGEINSTQSVERPRRRCVRNAHILTRCSRAACPIGDTGPATAACPSTDRQQTVGDELAAPTRAWWGAVTLAFGRSPVA
jgi:hypothetical protein